MVHRVIYMGVDRMGFWIMSSKLKIMKKVDIVLSLINCVK